MRHKSLAPKSEDLFHSRGHRTDDKSPAANTVGGGGGGQKGGGAQHARGLEPHTNDSRARVHPRTLNNKKTVQITPCASESGSVSLRCCYGVCCGETGRRWGSGRMGGIYIFVCEPVWPSGKALGW